MNRYTKLKDIFLGKPLKDEDLHNEQMGRLWGLPIMASDAVSSVAYAIEEILMILTPALGLIAAKYVGIISIPIILLLIILVFSYSQIINHYPNGGGAYIVSLENFGRKSALISAACLIIDYIMTVAVSVSSSTAAIIAAFPQLAKHKVGFSLICIAIITLINLRGINESSKIFGVPTYAFIISMLIMIVAGFYKMITGTLSPIQYSPEAVNSVFSNDFISDITLILFLRAFSSGCSALTGVEAVSNAIPAFKSPSQKTARQVLFMLGGIIILIFGGTSILVSFSNIIPVHNATIISQISNMIFGNGFMFYMIQFFTSMILLLAANTVYNGLPFLLSILAQDGYMPRQFTQRGTKLSFSNGIMFIFIVTSILLIVFKADTHYLIPFYSVGVFVSFTFSQLGMFIKWRKIKEKGWKYKSLINGLGALTTFIGTFVVFVTKFQDGAWILAVIIPILVYLMINIKKHYEEVQKQLSLEGYNYKCKPSISTNQEPCVLLLSNLNRSTIKTISYAKTISSNITAVHISTKKSITDNIINQWNELEIDIPLVILYSQYRSILGPLREYIDTREKQLKDKEHLTVIMTKYIATHWYEFFLHNQTTYMIENILGKHKDVVTLLVPYIYKSFKPIDNTK